MVYDYSYFNEIDVLEKADNFMATGEFSAAGDALTFLLKKEPHNPVALGKLMLATYKLKSISDLNNKPVLDAIEGDPKDTEWIVEEAEGDSRERLSNLHGKIEKAFRCAQINSEVLKIREDIEIIEKRKKEQDWGARGSYLAVVENGETQHPREYLKKNLWIITLIWILLMVVFIPTLFHNGEGFFVGIVVLSMFTAMYLALLFGIWKNAKAGLENIKKYEERSAEYAAEAEKLKAREHELMNEYNALRRDIKKD
jgi:hypothetical protein